MTATATCPHGTNIFETRCTRCDYERRLYNEAKTAYESVSHNINGGPANILGTVIGDEHPYLIQKLAEAVALGVLARTYNSLCHEKTIFTTLHPEHDGRLSCGTVIGAQATLATRTDATGEEVLRDRKYWLGRLYNPNGGY